MIACACGGVLEVGLLAALVSAGGWIWRKVFR